MKKVIGGAAAIAAVLVVAAMLIPGARAQQRSPDITLLVGPGSYIGLTVRDAGGDVGGVVVDRVRDDSPAARAGCRSGDIVLEFDGERVRSARQFTRLVRETPPGRAVKVVVQRDGSKQTLDVTPESRGRIEIERFPDVARDLGRGLRMLPRDFDFDFDFDFDPPRRYRSFELSPRRLGAELSPLSDQLAEYFGVSGGVLVASVDADTPAARAGLRAGDVVSAINGRAVSRPADVSGEFRRAEPGATLDVGVTRDRQELTLKLVVPERGQSRRSGLPV